MREWDRMRYQRDRDKRIACIKAGHRKYPEKERARSNLRNRVARGTIIKPAKCERCGGPGPIEGSHDDYSKPFDVEWLCRGCHVKKDRPRGYEV